MGGSPQSLSSQDIQDLQDIASKLPPGHPMVPKISTLLNANPTQFEKERQPSNQPGFMRSFMPGLYGKLPDLTADKPPDTSSPSVFENDASRKERGRSGLYRAAGAISDVTGLGMNARQAEDAAEAGDTGAVAGGAANAAAPLAIGGAAQVAEPIGNKIGLAARTEKGMLKPGIRDMSRVAGGGVGATVGSALHPGLGYGGAVGGAILGPRIADALIPERPFDIPTRGESVGAPFPSADEFYERRGSDLMKRGNEQTAIDKTTPQGNPSLFPKPLRPIVGTPEEWDAYERQMNILRPEASDAGTYHAARGSANKKVDLQHRIGKRISQ